MADFKRGVIVRQNSKTIAIVCSNNYWDDNPSIGFYNYLNNHYKSGIDENVKKVINKKPVFVAHAIDDVFIPAVRHGWKIMYNVHGAAKSIMNCTFSLYDEKCNFKTCIKNDDFKTHAGISFETANNIFVEKTNNFFENVNKFYKRAVFHIQFNAASFEYEKQMDEFEKKDFIKKLEYQVAVNQYVNAINEEQNRWTIKQPKRKIILD